MSAADKNPKGRMKKWILPMLVLVVTPLLAYKGCMWSMGFYTLNPLTFTQWKVRMVEERIERSLPEGTRGLYMKHKGPIDPNFFAKLEIPLEEVESFRAEIESIKERERSAYTFGKAPSWWWTQHSKFPVVYREDFVDGGSVEFFLIQEEQGWFLYVIWAIF